MYLYAQWLESSCSRRPEWVSSPCEPDVRGGYRWLVQAAEGGDRRAMYVLGVRLKHDWHVYEPIPKANGEWLVRRAIDRGFEPPSREEQAYVDYLNGTL